MKTLRLRGFRLETLLNAAARSGVRLTRARRTSPREVTVLSPASDADRLAQMAGEKGVSWEEMGEIGPSAWKKRLARRITLPAGALLMAAILYAFSGRVWRVDVEGADGPLDDDCRSAVYEALEEMNVGPGCAPPDTRALARALSAQCPELSYVGARVTGARLLISAAQADPPPEVYNARAARDLVASRDGIVLEVNALAGQAAVKPGDVVKRGDALILGSQRVSDEATEGIRALGSVTARVWSEATCQADLREGETRRTGNRRARSALIGPGFEIPLQEAEPFPGGEAETSRLEVVGMFAPLYIQRTIYYETETVPIDPRGLEARLRGQALARAAADAEGDIVKVWTQAETVGHILAVRAVIESAAQIAASRQPPGPSE